MNVKIGAEAALFPEKEYISGIFVAVLFCCARDNLGVKKVEAPSKCPEKGLKKLLSPKKKIMSQIFLNSGTLVILCLFATMGPQFYSLIQAIIRKMQIFKCLIQAIIRKMQIVKCFIQEIIRKMQIFKCFMSFCNHGLSIL